MEILEEWLNKNRELLGSEQVVGLFEDSIACYHANIVRPAYILSYQAMMIHLRNVILNGTMPLNYPATQWTTITSELRNETKWDAKVFTCTQQKEEPATHKIAILNIPDDIRSRFLFWRDIRNDCAHYKANNVIKAHVQALWAFIDQYLLTFTIEGGKDMLLKKFDDFFNPAKTAPGTDIRPLVDLISTMVKKDEMQSFFKEYGKIASKYRLFGATESYKHVLDNSKNVTVKKELIHFIQKKEEWMQAMIRDYPEMVLELYTDPTKVRELWYKGFVFLPNSWKVFVTLLMAGRIPPKEIKEACGHILTLYFDHNGQISDLTEGEVNVLKSNGYFDLFMEKYLNTKLTNQTSMMGDLCRKTDFYMSHIQYMDLDEVLLKKFIEVFSIPSPYVLDERVRVHLNTLSEDRKKTIKEILTRENLTLPDKINIK